MEDRNGTLCCGLRRYTLNGLNDDFLCFFVRFKTRIVHNLIDIGHSSCLGFIFKRFYQLFLSLFGTHAAQLLQLFLRLMVHPLYLLLLIIQRLLTLLHLLHFLIHFVEAALYISLTLVELLLTLLQALFLLLQAFVLLTHTIVVLQLQGDKLLFSLNNLVFLHYLRFFFRFLD